MGPGEWIALGALIVTILIASGGIIAKLTSNNIVVLEKIAENKDHLDDELMAMRIASYEEFKILRKEMSDASFNDHREFGESLAAIREKVNQIELWTRDQLKETRHSLSGSMDMRYSIIDEKIEKTNERVRLIEIDNARRNLPT